MLNQYRSRLYEVLPEYQFVLYDQEAAGVLAKGHTIPVVWGGTTEGLGPGIDARSGSPSRCAEPASRPSASMT